MSFDLKKYLAEGKLTENEELIQLKITSRAKEKLDYILEMKLRYYEENSGFFKEEIKIVEDILKQLRKNG